MARRGNGGDSKKKKVSESHVDLDKDTVIVDESRKDILKTDYKPNKSNDKFSEWPLDDRETEAKSIVYLSGTSTPGNRRGRPRENGYGSGYGNLYSGSSGRGGREAAAILPIPNISEEGRESQLVAMAVDLAERQLMEGTASSQVITHFLKLGTQQAKLEREKLARENELLKAKTEALHSAKRVEELYEEALRAMRTYSGTKDDLV